MSSRSSNNYPSFGNWHRVGFVKSAHGIRGEFFVKLFAGTADWIGNVDQFGVLAMSSVKLAETKIQNLKPHKDGLIVTLDDVRDRDAAEALKGAQIYVPDAALVSEKGQAVFLKEILGFEVRDPGGIALGRVVDFSSNGAQDLIVLARVDGGRALVPFVEAFVVAIDFDNHVLRVDLPPGLLTLGD